MSGKLLTVEQAAERLSVSRYTLRAWIYYRRIEFVHIGRLVRIREEEIERLIKAGTQPPLEAGDGQQN